MNFKSLSIEENPKGRPKDKLLHHVVPITCLKLLDRMVLVASEGPSILLKMAYLDSKDFQRFQLFPSQFVISGMEFIESPVLECGDSDRDDGNIRAYDQIYVGYVWAGSLGTLVRLKRSADSELTLLDYRTDDNWSHFLNLGFIPVAAKWLDGGTHLALLSVLNYLVIFERSERQPGCYTNLTQVKEIKCAKSETLFSGKISGNSADRVRIFSGTVFNGILVWDVVGGEAVIKHELKCHDGIIFSLEYYAERNILLSTSDDRTVGVWEFSKDDGVAESVKLLHRFYGHDARVWKALLIRDYILSVGESSEVRVNILTDGREHKTWVAHDGSPIFTCVYDEDLEILYTGGNDGSIRKWPKWWYQVTPRVLSYDVVAQEREFSIKAETESGTGRWSENKDFPKFAVLLDINHVLVAMESGRVIGIDWEGKQFDLLYDPRCEGYQIIRISPDHKVLAVAGNNGHFYTAQVSFTENQTTKSTILHAKQIFMTKIAWNIIAMIWLDVSRLMIVCVNKAIVLLLDENETGERSEVQFIQTFEFNLQKPSIPAAVEISGRLVVLGDEVGNLHLFQYHKTNKAVSTFEKAHKDGCTTLLYHESKLYSGGRDGKVRCFSIKYSFDTEPEFVPICTYTMNFDWVAGIYVNMGQMLCCGFVKKDFSVWSINEKRTLVRISCGEGGSRKWDFKYGHGTSGSRNASFTFIKNKEIFYAFLPMEGYLNITMKSGLHSRTINCAVELEASDNKVDYITGSEDGSLKWFQWDILNQNVLLVQCMDNHVSSVRTAMKISDSVSNQLFLFTGGGRSQLCIYDIDLVNQRLELLKEIILVKTTFKQTEGDVRIMDVVVTDRGNNELCCISACSDGIIRILCFNTKTHKFRITDLLNGNSHAVMRVCILNTASTGLLTIAGVTSNGYLMVWTWNEKEHCVDEASRGQKNKCQSEKPPEFQTLLRRTALMSLKVCSSSKNMNDKDECCYNIVCGGDDCSIALWALQIKQENSHTKYYDMHEKWTKDFCQRGAVVGVEIDDDTIYTLSNDQIVASWNMEGKLLSKCYAGVSDCQGFVLGMPNKRVMCFGKGIAWVPTF